ncbi:MAG: 16S rRNA (cytosine(967)-C(5))-methyltransferase RsmB [Eubacterium sp.]|nr:16S rRNA (cytosine(967)-C(5))-methyltransferase RsmB [Eubacterium sp.]
MNNRQFVFDILKKLEEENVYVSELLTDALRQIQFSGKRDRAFVTRLVEGVTERKITLDYIIDRFSKKGKKTGKNKISKDIRIMLRMGIYQIKYMDAVPDRAAISETVELAREKGYEGLTGYINGLLRTVSGLKEERRLDSFLMSSLEVRYSTPQWLCLFLQDTYGKDIAKKILEDQYMDHDTVIRVNSLKMDTAEMKGLLEEKNIKFSDGLFAERSIRIQEYDSVKRLPGYKEGFFSVQDETSTYAIDRLGIEPGDFVLDMCSSPGGKSLLAYEISCNNETCGRIVSRDISESKLERIQENAERLGVPVRVLNPKAGNSPDKDRYQPGINLEVRDATVSPEKEDKSYIGKFDKVIADVPCSGLGIIGRKNDIKYHVTKQQMEELSEMGLSILKNASRYVKKGGRICFSTCTINPGENQEVVKKFLESQEGAGFEIKEERTFLQGIDGSDGFYYCILS